MPASTTASSSFVEVVDDRRKHAIDFLVAAGAAQQQSTRLLSDISLTSTDSSSLTNSMSFLPLKRSRDIEEPQSIKRTRLLSDLSEATTTTTVTTAPTPALPTFEFGPGQGLLPPPPPQPPTAPAHVPLSVPISQPTIAPTIPLIVQQPPAYEAALSLASLPMASTATAAAPLMGSTFLQPTFDLFRTPTPTLPTTSPLDFNPVTAFESTTTPPRSTFEQLLPSSTLPPAKTSIKCGECKLECTDGASLTLHARSAHPSKPYACLVCGRCFGEKGNMNKHHRTVHLKQRKHSCATCGRCFAFMDGLNRHIAMVHLDRRPFECTFCQCPGGRHSESIPCTHICGMRFKQKSHRRRHVRSVHQATR